jgi:hypothetical protein
VNSEQIRTIPGHSMESTDGTGPETVVSKGYTLITQTDVATRQFELKSNDRGGVLAVSI